MDTTTTLGCQVTLCALFCFAGSSLGGWLALQLAIDHPAEVAGLLLIAPALDFTQRMWQGLTPQQQEVAQTEGRIRVASK